MLTTIETLFATWRGVLVKGVAGVGKSLYAAFLMRHYHSKGCTIVYQDAKREARWLLTPGAPVQEGSLTDFSDQLKQASTVYICDVGGRGSKEPSHGNPTPMFCPHHCPVFPGRITLP